MKPFPFTLATLSQPKIGLIVLQADETIEQEFRHLITPEMASLYVTRIPSGSAVTPETLSAMEGDLSNAASLLPPTASFDVVGYGCTSGTAAIGAERVTELVQTGVKTDHVTNPLSAANAALDHHKVKRVGIVSPYTENVLKPIVKSFEDHGLEIVSTISFGEETEARVARIDTQSIINAARTVAASEDVDGIFISCTNLRTLDAIRVLEKEFDIPILSSNKVMAWHLKVLAHVESC